MQVLVLRLDCLWSQERQISQGVESSGKYVWVGRGGIEGGRRLQSPEGIPTPLRWEGNERQHEGAEE